MTAKRTKNAAIIITTLALFLPLGISCSQSKPEITYGFMQLVYYQGETGPVERFSFFIIPADDDGIENLSELYLYHDREQLRWNINRSEWLTYTSAHGVTWIGTRGIALQNNQSLPRGQYRAVLINRGGESSERSFTFDGGARFPFPSLEVSEEGYFTVHSQWPRNWFVGYSIEGSHISTIEVSMFAGLVSELNFPASVRTIALWAEDYERYTSAFTNIVPIR